MIHIKRLLYYFCSSCRPNKSRTVRFAFPLAFASVLFLSAAVLTSDTGSYIKLVSNNSRVEAGEMFTIEVYVGAEVPVNAIDIAVDFPEDQIEVVGIDTGRSVITIWTKDPYVENNTVIIRGGTFRNGFVGEHLVAEINARAKKEGTAKFTTSDAALLAGDGRGTSVSITDTGYESHTMYIGLTGEDGETSIEGAVTVGIFTDIDGDGKVDMGDVLSFMSAWKDKSTRYDFNKDGKMTFVDFAIILSDSFFK